MIVGLDQGVSIADVGIFDALQQHVHLSDTQHGAVEITAVWSALVEATAGGIVTVDGIAVLFDQVLGCCDEKA